MCCAWRQWPGWRLGKQRPAIRGSSQSHCRRRRPRRPHSICGTLDENETRPRTAAILNSRQHRPRELCVASARLQNPFHIGNSANGANAKPTGLPASVSRQGRVCAAGNRSRHCELDPVGRAVVVHSRRLSAGQLSVAGPPSGGGDSASGSGERTVTAEAGFMLCLTLL